MLSKCSSFNCASPFHWFRNRVEPVVHDRHMQERRLLYLFTSATFVEGRLHLLQNQCSGVAHATASFGSWRREVLAECCQAGNPAADNSQCVMRSGTKADGDHWECTLSKRCDQGMLLHLGPCYAVIHSRTVAMLPP